MFNFPRFQSHCVFTVLAVLFFVNATNANSNEAQAFETEAQRQMYLRLTQELRCPKCQNQNIADSNSQIAIDLRNQVARLIKENQGEEQVKDYMVNRYGDFVLYEPPFKKGTLLLWFGPLIMALLGVTVFVVSVLTRRKNKEEMVDNSDPIDQGDS